MSSPSCEVAIIGGGLSGCAAAISLARAGVDVAVFEAGPLPRHRVCGEFLSPESHATLERLGVMRTVEAAGARPVSTARFCCDGHDADFALGEAAGIALSRFTLDPLLWQSAAAMGARTFLQTKVRHLESQGEGFTFQAGDQHWRAQTVIFATGRSGAPKTGTGARFCGIKAHFANATLESGVVEMHLFKGGYCGLVRVEGAATNACLLVNYNQLSKSSPADFFHQLLSQNPALQRRLGNATRLTDWQTTANVSFETFRPVGEGDSTLPNGILCAGDAAGYIHPLTGDGMAMALRAGELAGTVARLRLGNAEAARLYRAAWEREFTPRLALAAQIHPFAIRPQWAKPLLPLLRYLPLVRRGLVRGTRGASV